MAATGFALAIAALLAGAPPASAPRAPLVYVALGDSTAVGKGGGPGRGYPARLARRLEARGIRVELVNLAENGATAADVRRGQLERLAATHPSLVTVGVGINDVVRGRDPREFAGDLEAIADAAGRTGASVVLSSLPDLSRSPSGAGSPPSLSRSFEDYNAAIRLVARRHGFAVAEVNLARGGARGGARLFSRDGFHPSARGYEAWADAMWPEIERALGLRTPARRSRAGRMTTGRGVR